MPRFDVECSECGQTTETFMRADETAICPLCGSGNARRLIGLPAIKHDVNNDPVVEGMMMRNKAYYESRSDDIRSGKMKLEGKDAPRFMPQPDKRFH